MNTTQDLLAVLGSPIAHSKSPALHRAAYAVLGLPWEYGALDVTAEALPDFLRSRTAEWRGLSLTMPLKRTVLPLLDNRDRTAGLTGGANTVLFDDEGSTRILRGFNTDVYGITEALRAAGIRELRAVRLLGSGATAASALLAVSQLGAERVVVSARTPANAKELEGLAAELGLRLVVQPLDARQGSQLPDAVISTIPGGAGHSMTFRDETMSSAILLDVAYDPWPTPLAAAWLAAGGRVLSGLEMLLHQALGQVRIFVGGDPGVRLPEEASVLAAMRQSVEFD